VPCREQSSAGCPCADWPCSHFTKASSQAFTRRRCGRPGSTATQQSPVVGRCWFQRSPANSAPTCAVWPVFVSRDHSQHGHVISLPSCWVGVGRPGRDGCRVGCPTGGLGRQDIKPLGGPCPRSGDCVGVGLSGPRSHPTAPALDRGGQPMLGCRAEAQSGKGGVDRAAPAVGLNRPNAPALPALSPRPWPDDGAVSLRPVRWPADVSARTRHRPADPRPTLHAQHRS